MGFMIFLVVFLLFVRLIIYLRKENDKAIDRNMREAKFAKENESPNGWDNRIYRDLREEDCFQEGDIFYNPEWEVGGPWYFLTKNHEALGEKYIPGKMSRTRRLIETDEIISEARKKLYFIALRGIWGPVCCDICEKKTRIVRLSMDEFNDLPENSKSEQLDFIFNKRLGKAVCREHRYS